MALKSTIFKAALQIADMDRHYYADHALTLARHPSETDERLMVRLLAFALHAGDTLAFCKGLSDADEPDLWRKDLTGAVDLWAEVGQPDERRLGKACGRARQVVVYCYGSTAGIWWKNIDDKMARFRNLAVFNLPPEQSQALAALAQRSMRLQCTIQDGHAFMTGETHSVEISPVALRAWQ